MREQAERTDASEEHIKRCKNKLNVLLEQQVDLGTAIDQLLDDIQAGRKFMKVYRQMKMYNDPATNPVLYKKLRGEDWPHYYNALLCNGRCSYDCTCGLFACKAIS